MNGPKRIILGTPESDRALAAWENSRLDPPDDEEIEEEEDLDDYYPEDDDFVEATDDEYSRMEGGW